MSSRKGQVYYLTQELESSKKEILTLIETLSECRKQKWALEKKLSNIIHENNKLRKANEKIKRNSPGN